MLRRKFAVRAALVAAASLVAVIAPGAGAAHAGALNNQRVSGVQVAVSCLSAHLCVTVGYNEHSVGDVVEIHNGKPGHVSIVRGSQALNSVSCPSKAGCVAVGRTSNDVKALIVTIGKSGKVTHAAKIKVPSGVTIGRIDCVSIHSCEVAGTSFFTSPQAIEIGSWNGKKLTLHKVHGVHGSSSLSIQSVGCHGSSCVVVGSVEVGHIVGIVLPIHRGHAGELHKANNDAFYSASCASAKRCYAVGFDDNGGIIVTLQDAAVTHTASTTPDLFGIACHHSACTAVGKTLPPAPNQPAAGFWGTITTVAAGKPTSTVSVPASGGYTGVARPTAGFFAAIGSSQHPSSELTTN